MGKDVGWNQETRTATIDDKTKDKAFTKKQEPVISSKETLSQKNAVRKAEEFLSVMAFSRSSLIKQLEYVGFIYEDATHGVNKTSCKKG